jgi:hypothetical protein
VTAKCAPAGLKEPVESPFDGISGAYASEIDRSAMRTACREQPHSGAAHGSVSAFGVLDGVEYGAGGTSCCPATRRLSSRAALSCSGVLRSGSDTLTRSFARETWRLWRFNSLLFIVSFTERTHPELRGHHPRA